MPAASISTRKPNLAILWPLVRNTIFRWSGQRSYGLRRALLRLFGAQVDPTARVRPTVRIDQPWHLSLGRKSSIGDHVVLYAQAAIRIGDRSVVSQYSVLSSVEHGGNWPQVDDPCAPVIVGPDVWVATECYIAPGVVIPPGVVIGARSVVDGPLEPWTVAAGDPAHSLRPRPYAGTSQPRP